MDEMINTANQKQESGSTQAFDNPYLNMLLDESVTEKGSLEKKNKNKKSKKNKKKLKKAREQKEKLKKSNKKLSKKNVRLRSENVKLATECAFKDDLNEARIGRVKAETERDFVCGLLRYYLEKNDPKGYEDFEKYALERGTPLLPEKNEKE